MVGLLCDDLDHLLDRHHVRVRLDHLVVQVLLNKRFVRVIVMNQLE